MTAQKEINLALQGGGSHGAFTWGVLDRLLEIEELKISGISGTSAGAVNATLLAYGLMSEGKEKARELLDNFWIKNAKLGSLSPFYPTWLDNMLSPGNLEYNPYYHLISYLSPYQFNPLNLNPIEWMIKEQVDFDTIRNNDDIKIFISATNIRTSKLKVFKNKEITAKSILASCSLPHFFQATEIDGEQYWDGGYLGNPDIFPLFKYTDCNDLLIVKVHSHTEEKLPVTPFEIQDRATSISFNSSLMQEVRHTHFINKLVEKGIDDNGKLKKIHLHLVDAGEILKNFNTSSKANPHWYFVSYLKEKGKEKADEWLKENYDKIGVENSCDVERYFF